MDRIRSLSSAAERGDSGASEEVRAAWGELLARHERMLFAVCVRTLRGDRRAAEDLVQEAVVQIIRGFGSWDGRSRFSTWMVRVAMNACLSHLRKSRLRSHASLDGMKGGSASFAGGGGGGDRSGFDRTGLGVGGSGGGGGEEHSGVGRVSLDERRAAVARAMDSLSDEHRTILILRDLRGLEYEELGEVLGLAPGTVKSRLFRARAALREALVADGWVGDDVDS